MVINVSGNGDNLTLKSTDADANVGPNLVLRRDSSSPADDDLLGSIQMEMENSNGSKLDVISIVGQAKDVTAGTEDAFLQFNVITAGSLVDVFHISPTETVFNDASVDRNLRIESNGNATMLVVDGENNRVGFGTNPGRDFQFLTTDQTDVSIIAANNQYAQLLFGDPDDDNIGSIGYDNATNAMLFHTNTVQRLIIDSAGFSDFAATGNDIARFSGPNSGGLTIRNATANEVIIHTGTSDALIVGTAGNNERFRVTDAGIHIGGTGAANAFDDYEEGTFTPALVSTGASFAYTHQKGFYTKIGNAVTFNIHIQLDGGGNSFSANSVDITGLPFNSANVTGQLYRFFIASRLVDVSSSASGVVASLGSNDTTMDIIEFGDNNTCGNIASNQLSSSSGQLFVTGTYYV